MYDQQSLEAASVLFQRIENLTRREMLSYIYIQPRTYTDLIDHTGLKPGSLYHHLKILDSLVEKQEHGLYKITELGSQLVEDLQMVEEKRPEVHQSNESEIPLTTNEDKDTKLQGMESIEQIIWLGIPNILISIFIVTIVVILGIQDVVIAGSAIYAVYGLNAFLFDLSGIILGWFSIYVLDKLIYPSNAYQNAIYALVIRIMMMLPAVIVGTGVALVFLSGSILTVEAFQILFAITLVLGYLLAVQGLQYLRGIDRAKALNLALVPSGIDLLFGIVILLSN